ncbi:MAG: phosphotransferase [Hamadaea sp.]|uniref:phosphotransferase family protein n=1 Tax=Hamadaea sp. TaxID=2024425 RepID=UPI0017CF9D3B|nr:phosphotransferase [Hamadaea sp.]NUR70421.1 phosphotransferase [Hamadaea sp.]NUT20011.1 phosphotransferase [Hamadaea sp.]
MTPNSLGGPSLGGSVGGKPLGEGREAVVFAYGDNAVLKVYRPGFGGHRTEAAVLRTLDGHGVAPKLLDMVDHDGLPGLVIERLAGPDMLTLLQRQPWRVLAFGRRLAETHLSVHSVSAPSTLADLRPALATRIAEAELPRHLLDFATHTLDGLPDGDRLCHGDYHPGNVLLTGDQAAVIDWGGATRGVPEADYARTLLLLRWADPLPSTPPLARAAIAAGRSLLARAYARTYRRSAPPLREVQPWLAVQVAARLSEGIPSERAMLLARLQRLAH